MQTTQNRSVPAQEYRDIPLSQLVESPTNPRKRYDPAALEELAGSIRTHGVLEPLVVRSLFSSGGEQFEIVAGSRRFRGATLAGSETVPVRISKLSDSEVREVQLIENLQREDIHPLEEALGFRDLLELPDQQYTVARIAERSGKSAGYVAARLKLTELIPGVAEAFLADRLTIGHALLIAKLPPAQQEEAFHAAFRKVWIGSEQTEILVPVRELSQWIESNLLLDLQGAPFDRADATLVPEAGSCHDCTKRTGANTLLFPEAQQDSCLDGACWKTKVAAHLSASIERDPKLIQISENWKSANGESVLGRGQYVEITKRASRNGQRKTPPQQKKCPHIAQAIVVDGGKLGHVVEVCADPECETHHGEARKAKQAQDRMRAEHHKQEEQRRQELRTRQRVLAAILDKVAAPLGKADLELIAREFLNRTPQEYRTALAKRHSPAPQKSAKKDGAAREPIEIGSALRNLDETGYSRLLIEIALLEAASNTYARDGAEQLEAVAKRYRVNVEKIGESVAAEFAARRKERGGRPKRTTSGKPGAATKAARKRKGA